MFKITRKHYEIIINQARANYPRESGGFLGGKDGLVQAILPVYNKYIYAQHDTFALSSDDLLRAHEFFKKHDLDYYGFYHTHPKGAPYPSGQDVRSGQRFHFIIGMQDVNNPVLNAFAIKGDKVSQVLIELVENDAFQSVDIYTGKPKNKTDIIQAEEDKLQYMIERIKRNKPKYKKRKPRSGENSSFSTAA